MIAYGKGGALETIIEGRTGMFFRKQTTESLIKAVEKFEEIKDNFNPEKMRENALRFDKKIFKKEIKMFVERKYKEFENTISWES